MPEAGGERGIVVRDRNYLLWTVLATFFLVLLNLPESVSSSLRGFFRDGLATYQGGVSRAVSGLKQTSSFVGSRADAIRERDQFAREVADLRVSVQDHERLARENAELRAMLDLRQRSRYQTVACEVIARDDGYGWWQTLRLDKGREDGIAENMPVVTAEGLVGRTREVSAQACDVLLISDRAFKVSIRLAGEGLFGILQGGGVSLGGMHRTAILCAPPTLRVDYVRQEAEIPLGERVVTSGLGGVFPPDLPVGRVVGVTRDESGLYQHAEVEPVADLARIRRVLVITGQ